MNTAIFSTVPIWFTWQDYNMLPEELKRYVQKTYGPADCGWVFLAWFDECFEVMQ